jgi:hypothetical protein
MFKTQRPSLAWSIAGLAAGCFATGLITGLLVL